MDEQRLVASLKNHDPAGVEELFTSFGQRLLRSAFLLCGSETDAEDLVQQTFVEAIGSAGRFRGGSSLYTWLHAILLNLTRRYHRHRKRIIYDERSVKPDAVVEEPYFNSLDLQAASISLAQALEELSGPHREVLVMRFYENMKIHEIAVHLGISKGTVKSRLHYDISEMQQLMPREMNLFDENGTKEEMTR